MQRTKKSIKNLIFAIIGQFFGIIISFFARLIFVKILSNEYLGLNGLFTNILSILSLVELGVGPALTYSLYKPLAENDTEKLKSIMKLYKTMYIIIGILVLIIGIAIIPFLPFFIDNVPNIKENINLIYILFVINTAVSYFFTYKRSLIISDQKRYIATIYRYGCYFALNLFQIIILLLTKNYILYLIMQIFFTVLENILLSIKANKLYPFLKEKDVKRLKKEDISPIKKNTFAMMAHKMGGVIVNSTDNILIAKYIDLTTVGIYSNYYLITSALNTIISQFFSSIVASVGNLCVTEKENKSYDVFNKIFFANFWIYGFSSICLIFLANDFITIWLGEKYIFSNIVLFIIVLNFYITGMRKSILTFREAMGLYWEDRFKPIFEVTINIVTSIILVKILGSAGIFIGTIISTLTTCFWIEPLVLYKHGLKQKVRSYFMKYTLYSTITLFAGMITYCFMLLISSNDIFAFVLKCLICLIVPNICFLLFTIELKENIFYRQMIINYLKKLKEK